MSRSPEASPSPSPPPGSADGAVRGRGPTYNPALPAADKAQHLRFALHSSLPPAAMRSTESHRTDGVRRHRRSSSKSSKSSSKVSKAWRSCVTPWSRLISVGLLLVLLLVALHLTVLAPLQGVPHPPGAADTHGSAVAAFTNSDTEHFSATAVKTHQGHQQTHATASGEVAADPAAAVAAAALSIPASSPSSSSPSVLPSAYLYVIAPVFNPSSAPFHPIRRALYYEFAARMSASPRVRFVTVEAVFDPLGQTDFIMTDASKYPLHLQVHAPSVGWIKESLINYAVRRLPEDAKWIAWIDADVHFDTPDWDTITINALEQKEGEQKRAGVGGPLLQLFEHVRFLDELGGLSRSFWSFGYSVVNRLPLSPLAWGWHFPHSGFGWATSRSFFLAMGGLPETHLIGGADMYISMATQGRADEWISKVNRRGRKGLHPGYINCTRTWEEHLVQTLHGTEAARKWKEAKASASSSPPAATAAGSSPLVWSPDLESYLGGLSYVPVNVSHMYHGSEKSRFYNSREVLLMMHDYDPTRDITREVEEDEAGHGAHTTAGAAVAQPVAAADQRAYKCVQDAHEVGRSIVRIRDDVNRDDRDDATISHTEQPVSLLQQQSAAVHRRLQHVTRRRQLELALLTYFHARDVPERAVSSAPAGAAHQQQEQQLPDPFVVAAAASAAAAAALPLPVLLPGEQMDLLPKEAMQVASSSSSVSADAALSSPSAAYRDFWVIAVVFNPANFSVRFDLYEGFAARMQASGASLLTVECIFPVLGQDVFRVTQPDNPNHLQVRSHSVMWIKEDLINYAVHRLPPSARWVAWIDADVEFLDSDWVGRTIASLRHYAVVQMFSVCRFLNATGGVDHVFASFGYSAVHRMPLLPRFASVWYPHPGFAWAMRRDVFTAIGGLADFHIVGNGDRHFAYMLSGINDDLTKLHADYLTCTLQWRTRTQRLLAVAAERIGLNRSTLIGYTDMPIAHMWHGSRADRKYATRDKILSAHQYSPVTDLLPMAEEAGGQDQQQGPDGGVPAFASSSSSSIAMCPSPVSSMGSSLRELRARMVPADVASAELVSSELSTSDTASRTLGWSRTTRLIRMQQAFVAYFQGRNEDHSAPTAADTNKATTKFCGHFC